MAAGLGRAAPLGAVAGALIGTAVLVAGARRRSIIDVTHFVAAAVFVAALAAMTDLAAIVANQGQPEGGAAVIGGLIGSAMRAGDRRRPRVSGPDRGRGPGPGLRPGGFPVGS